MQKPDLFDPSLTIQPAHFSAEPDNLLRHQDSFMDLEEDHVTPRLTHTIPSPTRHSTLASTFSGHSSRSDSNLGLNLSIPMATESSRPSRGSFSSDGCTSPSDVRCTEPNNQCPALGIAYTVPQPRPTSAGPEREGEKGTSEAERRKLRDFYEKEGWLPAPQPSRVTRLRRKRAM